VLAKNTCESDPNAINPDRNNKKYCMDEMYRTFSGAGTWDHTDRVNNCQLQGTSQDKAQCCGEYPHRRGYDDTKRECCEFQ
jgi:hypothetical protein